VPESTSIADLVIKLGIDASGVQSGLQSAAAATRAFKDKIKPTMYGGFDPSALKAEMDAAAAISRIVQKKDKERELQDAATRADAANAANRTAIQARVVADAAKLQQQELNNLREFITNKYAVQDAIERADAANAANRTAAQARVVANAERLQQQELDDLREFITNKYAVQDTAERADAANAANKKATQAKAVADAERLQQQELDNLREDMIRRSAIQDTADRADAANAANKKATQAKAVADAAKLQQQELDNLREDMIRRSATQDTANRITRAQQLDAKRAADDARRDALSNMRADEAARNRAAMGKKHQQAVAQQVTAEQQVNQTIQRNMTAFEKYEQSIRNLDTLKTKLNVTTGKAILTDEAYYREIERLTVALVRQGRAQQAAARHVNQTTDAARVMTGVMGQASFAAEDFIQGMVFGDVRSALLGASNNLTMVARGLISLQAPAFQTALATAAIPVGLTVAVVGAALLAENLSHAVAEARTLEELLRNALIGMARGDSVAAAQAAVRMSQLEREIRLRAQAGVTDPTALSSEIIRAENEQLRLKEKLLELEREIERNSRVNSVTAKEMVTLQLGGVESRSELEEALYKEIQSGDAARIASGREALNTIARMEAAASAGQRENYINEARKLYEQLNNMMLGNGVGFGEILLGGLVGASGLDGILSDLTALNALEDVFDTGWITRNAEDQAALLAIRERLEKMGITSQEQLDAQIKLTNDLKQVEAEIADLETRRAAAAQLQTEAAAEALTKQREEITFLLRATEAEKELLRIKKEQREFMGERPIMMDPLSQAMADMAQNQLGIEFLQAQKDALVKEMHKAIPESKGGLEQNTFSAQAKAFEQIQKKPDEQQKKMVELLASIDQALANGGRILLVP